MLALKPYAMVLQVDPQNTLVKLSIQKTFQCMRPLQRLATIITQRLLGKTM